MANLTWELDQLNRSAQAQLGLVASRLASGNWWTGQNTGRGAIRSWAKYMVPIVMELRDLSRELAIAHYQLLRYVETGAILGEALDGDRSAAGLLRAFLSRVQAVADLEDGTSDLSADLRSVTKRDASKVTLSLDALKDAVEAFSGQMVDHGEATVDPYEWPVLGTSDAHQEQLVRILTEATQKYETNKGTVGSINDLLTRARHEAADKDDLAERQKKITDAAGSRGAGVADMTVVDAGRDIADEASHQDERVKMYARGTSNNPCAFCAMLASRGWVYKTELNGSDAGFLMQVVREYHPNCHCYPIIRWSEKSELPELNRYFMEQWDDVTGGHYGRNKLKVWRQWLSKKKMSGKTWGPAAG